MKQLTLFCYSSAYKAPPNKWGIRPGCYHCGGTGDAWDEGRDDWATPMRKCECCDGHGEH